MLLTNNSPFEAVSADLPADRQGGRGMFEGFRLNIYEKM